MAKVNKNPFFFYRQLTLKKKNKSDFYRQFNKKKPKNYKKKRKTKPRARNFYWLMAEPSIEDWQIDGEHECIKE
jgi:hypothetical protein